MRRFYALTAALLCAGLLSAYWPDWDYIANGDQVTGICEYQGRIWASTSAGLCVIDPATGAISHLDKNDTGLPVGPLNGITLDQEGIPWVAVPHFGTASFEGGNWSFHWLQTNHSTYWHLPFTPELLTIDQNNGKWATLNRSWLIYAAGHDFFDYSYDSNYGEITAIHADPWHTVWVTSNEVYPTDVITLRAITDSLQLTYINYLGHPFTRVNAICADAPGCLWLATDGGVLRREGENWSWFDQQNSALPQTNITAITLDAQNSPLLGSADGWLIQRSSESWTGIGPAESGIGAKRIDHILIDGAGDWWIGTDQGLHRKSGNSWAFYPTSEYPLTHNPVGDMLVEPDGGIWMGGENGLEWMRGETVISYTTQNSPLLDNNAKVLGQRDGEIWIATAQGFNVISGASWASHPFPELAQSNIMTADIAFGPDNSVWISASTSGLYRFEGNAWTHYGADQMQLPYLNLTGVEIDQLGRAWLSSFSGIACLDGAAWTVFNTGNSPLPDNRVPALALAPDGKLWFATLGGLAAYAGSWWMTFTELSDGLPSNGLDDVWIDSAGAVWFHMMNFGLGKTDGYNFEFMDAASSGLPDNTIDGFGQDAAGHYYFSSLHGLAIWDPEYTAAAGAVAPALAPGLKIWPNPSRQEASIGWQQKTPGRAELRVYNARGQLVRELDLGQKGTGGHEIAFDAKDSSGRALGSGVYFFKLSAGGQASTGKALILK